MAQYTTVREAQEQRLLQRLPQALQAMGRCLAQVPDPRHRRGVRYPWPILLLLILLAKLAGADHPLAMGDWLFAHRDLLWAVLPFPKRRIPHADTLRRALQRVDGAALERALHCLSRALVVEPGSVVVVDGKSLRGTRSSKGKALHLLTAYDAERGVVWGTVRVAAKENEIVQAPTLLRNLDLQGRTVVADAMHTQRALSQQIRRQGGHYVWFVKGNQPGLYDRFRTYFAWATTWGRKLVEDPPDLRWHQEVDKGHGRIEIRTIWVSTTALEGVDWPHAQQAFWVQRRWRRLEETTWHEDQRYGITSHPPEAMGAARLGRLVRMLWRIENSLHYRRDVTFQEDRLQTKWAQVGQAMAVLHHAVIAVLQVLGCRNHARARRWLGGHVALMAQALGRGLGLAIPPLPP